jgi:tetratricopeptide (TPR) repeat protein
MKRKLQIFVSSTYSDLKGERQAAVEAILRSGNIPAGMELFAAGSALLIVPKASQLWQQKAMPLFKQKKYELGMPFLDSAVKYDKTNHWLEYRAFMKCIFQKSYRAAINDFNLAIKKNGNSWVMDHSYVFYKGLCYLQLNKLDSAEFLFRKEMEQEIKDRKEAHYLHWFYMGVLQHEQDKYAEAITSFDNSLRQYSQFSDAQYYKAVCLFELKQINQALDVLNQAKENLKFGYTLNEDNAIYEAYPYQINKFMINATIDGYRDELSQKK